MSKTDFQPLLNLSSDLSSDLPSGEANPKASHRTLMEFEVRADSQKKIEKSKNQATKKGRLSSDLILFFGVLRY